MTLPFVAPHAASARAWAVWMTRHRSVTGTEGERSFPGALLARVRETPALAAAETFLIPASNDALGRACAAVLVRGTGPATVVLTGHFDTVTTSDYGDLDALATDPEALLPALMARLASARTPDEELARDDLASGAFLPGRGLLDMKGGLAAGLAALELFAADPERTGNLLFVAVPDEEVNSVGARAFATACADLQSRLGLRIAAAINLDCIGDRGDGCEGRSVALGSVGKLLVTAFVVGIQSHASHPFQGLNAGALAAALAAKLEWASELADTSAGLPGIAPTLLSLKDSKEAYDVTTPPSVFVTWNTLSMGRPARETLAIARRLVVEALADLGTRLASRRAAVTGEGVPVPRVVVRDAAELMRLVPEAAMPELMALGTRLAREGLSLPDQNRLLTEAAWRLAGLSGPGVVLGFGSLPYPAVSLGETPAEIHVRAAVGAMRNWARESLGIELGLTGFFPGISDMSFLGQADTADVALIAANTPCWDTGVRWSGEVCGVPTVNIGPWGRDYHTPLERIHTPYAFEALPLILNDISRRLLEPTG